MQQETVWTIADIFYGLMAIPNLTALLLLSPLVIKITRDFCHSGRMRDKL